MSKIEWTDETWNPQAGCSKVSPGCANCYAEALARRFQTSQPGRTIDAKTGKWNGAIFARPDQFDKPLRRKTPTVYFVGSMTDIAHPAAPPEIMPRILATIAATPRHHYLLLTKRPRLLRRMIAAAMDAPYEPNTYQALYAELRPSFTQAPAWPFRNAWLGVSAERQKEADSRIPELLETPAAGRFVSYEPALGPIDFRPWLWTPQRNRPASSIDWLIAGGESGPRARPTPFSWIESAIAQCHRANTPIFVKQLTAGGRKIPYQHWPAHLRIRQNPVTAHRIEGDPTQ